MNKGNSIVHLQEGEQWSVTVSANKTFWFRFPVTEPDCKFMLSHTEFIRGLELIVYSKHREWYRDLG